MKTLALTLMLTALSISNASAAERLLAYASTCSSLQNFLQRNGKAVVYTSPETYDLVVLHGGFCEVMEMAKGKVVVKARDRADCFLGFRCGPR